jgi:hypothetical protein
VEIQKKIKGKLNENQNINLAMATFCLSTAGRIGCMHITGILLGFLMGGGAAIGVKTVAKCSPRLQRKIMITRASVKESILWVCSNSYHFE